MIPARNPIAKNQIVRTAKRHRARLGARTLDNDVQILSLHGEGSTCRRDIPPLSLEDWDPMADMLWRTLAAAVDNPAEYVVIRAVAEGEQTYAEAAALLGISPATVKRRLLAERAKIRLFLTEAEEVMEKTAPRQAA